jgi:hypothetical protein
MRTDKVTDLVISVTSVVNEFLNANTATWSYLAEKLASIEVSNQNLEFMKAFQPAFDAVPSLKPIHALAKDETFAALLESAINSDDRLRARMHRLRQRLKQLELQQDNPREWFTLKTRKRIPKN